MGITAIKAIRLKCIDCTNNQLVEIKNCLILTCPLYPFRMGKNPNIKRIGVRKGNLEALEKARLARRMSEEARVRLRNKKERIIQALEKAGHTGVKVHWDTKEWSFISNQGEGSLGVNVDAALRAIKMKYGTK